MANQSVSAAWLTQHIRENIPLAESMKFEIARLGPNLIEVVAPLEPNINLHGTGFAGSLYSLSVLTAWGLTSALLMESGLAADVVIRSAEIKYRKPVKTDIRCECICSPEAQTAFIEGVTSEGKGRLLLKVNIGDAKAFLNANMVAIKQR